GLRGDEPGETPQGVRGEEPGRVRAHDPGLRLLVVEGPETRAAVARLDVDGRAAAGVRAGDRPVPDLDLDRPHRRLLSRVAVRRIVRERGAAAIRGTTQRRPRPSTGSRCGYFAWESCAYQRSATVRTACSHAAEGSCTNGA